MKPRGKKDKTKISWSFLIYLILGILLILFTGGLIVLYFCKFSGGLSDEKSDWNDFAVFASFCWLPLAAGVTMIWNCIRISKKEKKEEEEKVKLLSKNEKESFYKLKESHREVIKLLTYTDRRTGANNKEVEALKRYKEELDLDLELLIIIWKAGKYDSLNAWLNDARRFGLGNFDKTLLVGRFAYDMEISRREDEPSLIENDQFAEEIERNTLSHFRWMRQDLRRFIDEKYINPIYINFTTDEKLILFNYAWETWYYSMDNSERFSIIKLISENFYKKHNESLNHYISDLCNALIEIDGFEEEQSSFMEKFISSLTVHEYVILFFWMLSGHTDRVIFDLVIKYNFFEHLDLKEFCSVKFANNKETRATREYLQMQLAEEPTINLYPVPLMPQE